MYIFGGYSGFYWLNDFHKLNLHTFEWTLVIPREGQPPSTRFGYVSAVWRSSMFIFGGYDGAMWLNDLHEFEFESSRWSRVEPTGQIPNARSCPSWATHNSCVYVFGGYDGVHRLNDFYQFNAETYVWSQITCTGPSPSPRYFHESVVYGDSLYIFGGYSGAERLQDLYQFRFDRNCWSIIEAEDAPSGRSSLIAQVHGQSMYIFGGYDGSLVLNDFHEFQFEPVSIPRSTFLDDLKHLVNNTELSDVTFVVDGREIHAIKAFLAARSDHFRAMLFGGLRENSERRIVIHGVDYHIFLMIVEFLYTDQIPEISYEIAVPLLIAAELYMLDRLKAICQDIIRKEIDNENVVSLLIAAHNHRAFSLKEICLEYIISEGEEIRHSPSFQGLMTEPELMMEILLRIK